jgi:hypothetical protein
MRQTGVLAACIVAMLAAGCGSTDLGPQIAAVKKVEHTYLTAIATGDGATACSQLTSAQIQAVVQSGASIGAVSCPAAIHDFARTLKAAAQHQLETAQIVNPQVNGNAASVQLKGSTRTYTFAKVGGKWLISGGVSGAPAASSTAVPSAGVSAASYVRAVCSAVAPFEKSVQTSAGAALNSTAIKNPAQGKTALVSFMSTASKDAATALSQLKAAGVPKVAGGSGIGVSIVTAFERLATALQTASSAAASIPTSSASAFRAAATGLGTTVRDSINGISVSLGGLKSPALQAAAAKDPACASL